MKKNVLAKVIGLMLAAVCVCSTMGALAVCGASAAETEPAAAAQESAQETIGLEPGIYPMDAEHYLVVNEDHTFYVVYAPATDPAKAPPVFQPAQ